MHGLMNRAVELMLSEIHRYEGTVNHFLGDGIMALFGAPIAHEDHAQRACFAALHLRDALRGYPTNYQRGAQRLLFTAERRFYSDWYPYRLIRVGGAVFYDVGRAWGGPYEAGSSRHWPADIGFGLRLLSARSSSGTTLHVDVAFPLEREPGVKAYQFSFQSKTGF